jgi:alpha-ketoglutaric semialdehyde dehydrogenase
MAIERHHLTLSKTMTMNITGQLLIGDRKIRSTANSFQAHDPSTGQTLEPSFSCASPQDIDLAATLAAQAFDAYRATSAEQRATFLETIATGIEALGATLIERAMAETGLPNARLMGERGRTTGQLRLFAQVLRAGIWQQATVDTAMPDRQPMRRSDLRMQQIALGPVAVFGASNFPLAFSVAGGDTAAALAAGCPVIVKAHPSHPGTSELVARVIQAAVKACGFPQGTFSMVAGTGNEVGSQLVAHPAVQAVAFTGSRAGGLALCAIARARHQPIPVYAEMSAINPVFLLPQGLAARAEAIATGFVDSLVLGAGQFCTNPGLVLGIKGPAWDRFVAAVSTAAAEKPAATMLNAGIHRAYIHGTEKLCAAPELSQVAQGRASSGSGYTAQAHIYETTAHAFLRQTEFHDEVFGPSSVLVRCEDLAEMRTVAEGLEGQLTATLQIDPDDYAGAAQLLPVLERKAGRILVNGFPTGVEVSYAMVHGGPFPATSDPRGTSVGSRAIERFLRPVCYQDFPDELLPVALKFDNPSGIWRQIDGELSRH